MIGPSLHAYLAISALLFALGFLGVLIRRNTLVVFMCLELMLVASTLALVTFSRFNGTMDGNVFVFFILTVAAAEVAVTAAAPEHARRRDVVVGDATHRELGGVDRADAAASHAAVAGARRGRLRRRVACAVAALCAAPEAPSRDGPAVEDGEAARADAHRGALRDAALGDEHGRGGDPESEARSVVRLARDARDVDDRGHERPLAREAAVRRVGDGRQREGCAAKGHGGGGDDEDAARGYGSPVKERHIATRRADVGDGGALRDGQLSEDAAHRDAARGGELRETGEGGGACWRQGGARALLLLLPLLPAPRTLPTVAKSR